MKFAIAWSLIGCTAQFLGRCPEYTLVECAEGKVQQMEVIPNPGHEPGFYPVTWPIMVLAAL